MSISFDVHITALVHLYAQDHGGMSAFNEGEISVIRSAIIEYRTMGSTTIDAEVNAWMSRQSIEDVDFPEVDQGSLSDSLLFTYNKIATMLGLNNVTLAASITEANRATQQSLFPFYTFEKGEREEPVSHPVLDLMEDMNLLDGESSDWIRQI
ncbi:unnamed protein product, partial [marine sediment metagenome]